MATLALAAAALFGTPAAGAASPRQVESTPALRIASFDAHGSGGWVLGVSASPGRGKGSPGSIGLTTHGPHHEEVDYIGLKAQVTPDGRIVANAPRLGRIAVGFEETSETVLDVHPRKGCTVEGRSTIRKGVFRGAIEFHGERGYTTVARRSARGEIVDIPREVCKRRKHRRRPPHQPGGDSRVEYLLAARRFPCEEVWRARKRA